MGIGKRIKELRESKKMTQEQLALAVGVTKGAIANYENGVSHPRETIIYKLFDILECDANYLFQDMMEIKEKTFISLEDKALLESFNKLDDFGKKGVKAVLNAELERPKEDLILSEKEKELIKQIRGFDEHIRNDLLKYISDLYRDRDEIPKPNSNMEEKAN